MKKLLLILFYLLFFLNLSSQNWFSNNDEWYYGTIGYLGEAKLVTTKMFVEGDTIIDDQSYKILKTLKQIRNISSSDTSYIERIYGLVYEENDKVYWRTNQGNNEVIYNFSLEIGDTIFYPNQCTEGVNLILKDNGIEVINGVGVRYQDFHVEPLKQVEVLNNPIRIYEGIGIIFGPWYDNSGHAGLYLPWNLFCGFVDPPTRFFCYSNDSFEYPIQEGECDISIETVTNLSFPQIESKIDVYPNPCTDQLTIKSNGLEEELLLARITLIDGKVLKEVKILNNQPLNISDLSQGLYFLVIYSEGQLLERKIIVKSGT